MKFTSFPALFFYACLRLQYSPSCLNYRCSSRRRKLRMRIEVLLPNAFSLAFPRMPIQADKNTAVINSS